MSRKRRKSFDDMTPDEQRMLIHCKMAENMDEGPWWPSILISLVICLVIFFAIYAGSNSYIASLPDPSADCVLSESKCNGKSELVARRLKLMTNQGPFKE